VTLARHGNYTVDACKFKTTSMSVIPSFRHDLPACTPEVGVTINGSGALARSVPAQAGIVHVTSTGTSSMEEVTSKSVASDLLMSSNTFAEKLLADLAARDR
jgi:hypothetical protein